MESYSVCVDLLIVLALHICIVPVPGQLWSEWWTYQGISGPKFWGYHNPEWILCRKGKLQSPIDIDPHNLIYDQNLRQLEIGQDKIDGKLINTGHDLTLTVDDLDFTFTGGPLSYDYIVYEIKIHLGNSDRVGSEHTVGGNAFPMEIQIVGYNGELYTNASQALLSPHGLAAISVMAMVTESGNEHFGKLVDMSKSIEHRGMQKDIQGFSVSQMLPTSDYFITYEGSLTQPGCHETVTWIILNKPIHVSKDQLNLLRELTFTGGKGDGLMENNFRPPLPLNRRLVRTNIQSNSQDEECHARKVTFYQVNYKLTEP
ncbi:carbonic anhydrase-related protein 10-like [Mizuhopecten yessoensis]|uniref:carbonic anhydrase-related protein 10-like n=1 Tax=Mizuhopecten yessoensis TaxID=6573 RepID=UPI000B45D9D2|nr:carbonic anhydrase-related protein 10-like [Mizuhopecten yessoensis]